MAQPDDIRKDLIPLSEAFAPNAEVKIDATASAAPDVVAPAIPPAASQESPSSAFDSSEEQLTVLHSIDSKLQRVIDLLQNILET